jgi:hypothetical protein
LDYRGPFNYQRKERKSNHKFEVVGGQELMVGAPLPMAEVWAEMQTQVEELTGQAGLQILRAILENEVRHRVGLRIGPTLRPAVCAGGSSRAMWSLLDRKSSWNGHGYECGKYRKWNWRADLSRYAQSDLEK